MSQLIFDLLFVMDIVLMFFTSTITKKGQETYDSITIRNQYLQSRRFILDLLSCFGIQFFVQIHRTLQFFGFFKMTRVLNVQKMIANSTFDTNTKAIL